MMKNNEWAAVAYLTDDGETYTYTVRAINDGVYSCFYPQGTTLKSIDAPMDLSLENRVSGVMLNWNKCAGADGYYVVIKKIDKTTDDSEDTIRKF